MILLTARLVSHTVLQVSYLWHIANCRCFLSELLSLHSLGDVTNGDTMRQPGSFIVVLIIAGLFAAADSVCTAQPEGEEIPEVVIETESQGFYRPEWRYMPQPVTTLPEDLRPAAAQFAQRLEYALDWSGYVTLLPGGEVRQPEEPDSAASSPPPMQLRVTFRIEGIQLRAEVRLFDANEAEPFYSGGMTLVESTAERSAETMAEALLYNFTGMTPPFRSRIACVQPRGENVTELVMLTYDGGQRWPVTRDGSVALSPSWAPDGMRLVFSSFRGGGDANLYIADLSRRRIHPLIQREGADAAAAWSPDGNWIAFAGSHGSSTDIYIIRPDATGMRNLTASPAIDTSPSWSPNGQNLVFMSDRTGSPQIYRMDIDGANLVRLTYEGNYNAEPAWSPNGDWIVFSRRMPNGFQLFLMASNGERTRSALQLTRERGNHVEPSWSPDGMKITYSHGNRVWVMNADGTDPRPLLADGRMSDWMNVPPIR